MDPTYAHILGHDAVIERIEAARAVGRLPHGLIFSGPVGVGKTTTARALTRVFLGGDAGPLVEAGTHPDYHLITRQLVRYHDKTGKSKAIAMSIEVIREELVKPASLSSVRGGGKVFVVAEAETMTVGAQNAMLKTLEEPHGRTLVILLTRDARELLPTIRSRCQAFQFSPLAADDVATVLERNGLSGKDAADAAKLADGSPGLALQLHADGILPRARQLFGILRGDLADLPGFLQDAGKAYGEKTIERDPLGSKDAATREGVALYLQLAARYYRAQLAETDDVDRLEMHCQQIDALGRADRYLAGNVNTSLVFQQLALSL